MVINEQNVIYLIVAVAVIAIGAIAYAFYKKKEIVAFLNKPETIAFIKKMIVAAEDAVIGSKVGKERLQWVIDKVIEYAGAISPTIAKYLNSAAMMRLLIEVIQKFFDELVHLLPDGTRRAMFEEDYVRYMRKIKE